MADEYRARIERLRQAVESAAGSSDRGAEAVAKSVRKPLPEDIDFMHASREELVALRKAIAPLTRGSWPSAWRGSDATVEKAAGLPSTVRHRNCPTAAFRLDPSSATHGPSKPEIVRLIADIFGIGGRICPLHTADGVRHRSQFSRVRSFVFIDGIDEVTDIQGDRGPLPADPPHQHRGRRHLGGRPLRLRPRLRGVLGPLGADHNTKSTRSSSATPQQLSRGRGVGAGRDGQERPATSTGSTPSPVLLGHRRLDRRASTPPIATVPTSAEPQAA